MSLSFVSLSFTQPSQGTGNQEGSSPPRGLELGGGRGASPGGSGEQNHPLTTAAPEGRRGAARLAGLEEVPPGKGAALEGSL